MFKTIAAALLATSLIAGPVLAQGNPAPASQPATTQAAKPATVKIVKHVKKVTVIKVKKAKKHSFKAAKHRKHIKHVGKHRQYGNSHTARAAHVVKVSPRAN